MNMLAVSEAKITTFRNQIANGNLTSNRHRVFDYVNRNPGCSLEELSDGLNLSYHSVSGRLSELMDSGLIYIDGSKSGTADAQLSLYYVASVENQKLLIENRRRHKLKLWLAESANYIDLLPSDLVMALEIAKVA